MRGALEYRAARALVVAAVALAFFGGSAHAGEPGGAGADLVGVLHIGVEGVSEAAAERFEASIEEELAAHGFRVASRERLHSMLVTSPYVEGCTFGPCLQEVFAHTEIRLVLVAQVSVAGPSYSIVASLIDTRSGRPTSQVAERCAVCTLEEAVTTATLAVLGLVTGGGGATVTDPEVGPMGAQTLRLPEERVAALEARAAAGRRGLRRNALLLFGAAVVAGGVGAYLVTGDRPRTGYAAVGAGGALVLAGGTMLIVSRRF